MNGESGGFLEDDLLLRYTRRRLLVSMTGLHTAAMHLQIDFIMAYFICFLAAWDGLPKRIPVHSAVIDLQ